LFQLTVSGIKGLHFFSLISMINSLPFLRSWYSGIIQDDECWQNLSVWCSGSDALAHSRWHSMCLKGYVSSVCCD